MSTSLNRRVLMAGAAALPAVTVTPAAAACWVYPPDDILALIQKHREAYAYYSEALDISAKLTGKAFDVADEETGRRDALLGEAEDEMVERPPATTAGWVALIEYMFEHKDRGLDFLATAEAAPKVDVEDVTFEEAMLRNVAAWLRAPR